MEVDVTNEAGKRRPSTYKRIFVELKNNNNNNNIIKLK
jgi:hypothetical protein